MLRRLALRTEGVVAMEFALLAVPFFAVLFVVLNSALMIFCNAVVQGAVAQAARQIETGQMQNIDTNCPPTQNSTLTTFQTNVCKNLFGQLPCANLYFDVHSFATFGAINMPAPTYNAQGKVTNNCFNTGGSGSIVAVRVIYAWQNMVPGLTNLMHVSNTTTPIQYTVIVKNEPF
ncbi:MAG TPA: TadE/TadG family type IV pilus assembly protein [Aliidongia sp.]|uniref:TadE/TadG family type IV pilus assembly protein n=1 Tax=Aliidongia sp. TaxID=1914230 RepID=UPI002DDCC0EA|nr:TadE/TadG family type IV pilus assembly protein [Aliidongia sp.]HEV2676359.1 TadE/TadG family type IV pilus assembly protein [Aliidongia sp.]